MNRKRTVFGSFLCLLLCYVIWGMQPLYWATLTDFDTMFVMCVRAVTAMAFTWLYLIATGRFGDIVNTIKNKELMKLLVPASVFLCADWTLFILAVSHGHVLDTSLGYYFNPLVMFLVGVFFFKEKSDRLEYIAIGIACTGIVIATFKSSAFPALSLCFAVVWPVYATIKKLANTDPLISFAVETALMTPFAVAAMLIFYRGSGGLSSVDGSNIFLLIGSGIVTALPMILYNLVVNALPFKVIGVTQYLSSTISFLCGVLFMSETVTGEKLVMFSFVWAGLILFTVGNFRKEKKLS